MVFLTLGSQKFQFNRLLKAMDDFISNSVINTEVFAQIGYSDYMPQHYSYEAFLDRESFAQWEEKADIVLTHGGTGAIIGAVKKGKKVIAIPRLKQYGEHVDDHQLQIIDQFKELGFIIPCYDVSQLPECFAAAQNFRVKEYISNTDTIIADIEKFILDAGFLKG